MRISSLSFLLVSGRRCFIGDRRRLAGIVLRSHPGVIAVEVFGSIAAPQFAFVAVSLTDHLIRRTRLVPQVRAAIGQQLRAELEVPRSLPPELATLVTQLGHA